MKKFLAMMVMMACFVSTFVPQSTLAQTSSANKERRTVDKTFVIRGKERYTTVTLLPGENLAARLCGKQLFFAKGGDWIRFDCKGGGAYYNATGVPPNGGELVWGYRISDEDPKSLVVSSFRDSGFGTVDKPTLAIMYQFTKGLDDSKTIWGGALGEWTDGRVMLINGHIPIAGGFYISNSAN